MATLSLRSFVLALGLASAACSFHSTATHWNGRVGPDGKPVFLKYSTNIAFNILIVVPFLGRATMDSMVGETTRAIAETHGDRVRIIESSSENYWYGFPPITWFVTPVITTVSAEYLPSEEELTTVREKEAVQAPPANDR